MNLRTTLGVCLCFYICGCAAQPVVEPSKICPGKSTIFSALQSLANQRENAQPVRATGSLARRYKDAENKLHKDRLDINLVFCPPDYLYLRGNVLGSEAIGLGTNTEEFWFRIKPGLNTYWWGRWNRPGYDKSATRMCLQRILPINPFDLLEAFGGGDIDGSWSLSNEGAFDVLTRTGPAPEPAKKIYVNCCDYLIRKIEYFGEDAQPMAVVELDDYTMLDDTIAVPTRINIECSDFDLSSTRVKIKLKNVKLFDMSPMKIEGVFVRPEPTGFRQILKLNHNCEFVQQ